MIQKERKKACFACAMSMDRLLCLQYNILNGAKTFPLNHCCVCCYFVLRQLFMFLVYEACLGLYFPAMGTCRSKYIDDRVRGTVMNITRCVRTVLVSLLVAVAGLKRVKLPLATPQQCPVRQPSVWPIANMSVPSFVLTCIDTRVSGAVEPPPLMLPPQNVRAD